MAVYRGEADSFATLSSLRPAFMKACLGTPSGSTSARDPFIHTSAPQRPMSA